MEEKKIILILVLTLIIGSVFAEGNQEVDKLIAEVTETIQEVTGFTPSAIEGLIEIKKVYFKTLFPILFWIIGVSTCMLLGGIIGIVRSEYMTEELYIAFIITGGVVLLITGIIMAASFMDLKQFEVSPEIYVIRKAFSSR